MLVPDPWNGTLIVYSRGTGSAIKIGPSGDPIIDPVSRLPIVGVTPLTNVPGSIPGDNTAGDALENVLLSQGYAMVASDYKPDPRFIERGLLGWVVEDGIRDTVDVTFEAQGILSLGGATPVHTVSWGRSQGSLVALKLLEQQPHIYNGAMSGCTVGAGTPRTWDTAIGFALAYDIVFQDQGGWDNSRWGIVGGGNLPENLSFQRDVAPTLAVLLSDPQNFVRFEFIRLVNGLPAEGFYPRPTPNDLVGGAASFNWLFTDMLFLTEVRADLESKRKANGRVGQNKDHVYRLTEPEKAYLVVLAADLGVELDPDALLLNMNRRGTHFQFNRKARQYAEDYADFNGTILGPVISMHTRFDGLVIPAHESAYQETLEATGNLHNLTQVYTEAVGHCAFTWQQWLAVVKAMQNWLLTGTAPTGTDFPVGDRFIDFTPPPWPQPPQG
jgi:hypothetical protein